MHHSPISGTWHSNAKVSLPALTEPLLYKCLRARVSPSADTFVAQTAS